MDLVAWRKESAGFIVLKLPAQWAGTIQVNHETCMIYGGSFSDEAQEQLYFFSVLAWRFLYKGYVHIMGWGSSELYFWENFCILSYMKYTSFSFCQHQMCGVKSWTVFGTCTEPLQGEQRIPRGSRSTLQSTLSCHLWSKLCTLIFYLLSLFKGELAACSRSQEWRQIESKTWALEDWKGARKKTRQGEKE